jgi:hypothetical protein
MPFLSARCGIGRSEPEHMDAAAVADHVCRRLRYSVVNSPVCTFVDARGLADAEDLPRQLPLRRYDVRGGFQAEHLSLQLLHRR